MLLVWCDSLLASKMNLKIEDDHTLNIKMWYALFQSCNGETEDLSQLYERRIKTLSCLDEYSLLILQATLHEVHCSSQLIRVISEYAQQKIHDPPNFTSKQDQPRDNLQQMTLQVQCICYNHLCF
jgi:hypothetical protein